MKRVSPGTGLNGSALAHLLAGWGVLEAPAAPPAFVEGLGHWLDWTHAIPLHAALVTDAPAPASRAAGSAMAEVEALRDALVRGITDEGGPPEARRRRGPPVPPLREPPAPVAPPSLDVSTYRRRHADQQRAMDVALEALRERLRDRLAGRSAAGARLAAVDAVMARALAPREQTLLGLLPTLLERRFEQLRAAQAAADPSPSTAWLDDFQLDLQRLLLAELELRMLPLVGLAEALAEPTPNRCSPSLT